MRETSFSKRIASLSDEEIRSYVGRNAWENALALSAKNAVKDVVWHQEEDALEGRVREGGLSYKVRITVRADRLQSGCACSLRSHCAHVAALLLDVRNTSDSTPSWEELLGRALGTHSAQSGESFALLIDAHDPATPISLHPLRAGNTVRWSTKRASWLDVSATQWASVMDGMNPSHVALLREAYRLSHEKKNGLTRHEVTLESLGEKAYDWLVRARRAGIVLLSDMHTYDTFSVSSHVWEGSLDVSVQKEGIHLRPVVRSGEDIHIRPRIVESAQLVILNGGTACARVEKMEELKDFPTPEGLHIPTSDIAAFITSWLPALREHFPLLSSDGTLHMFDEHTPTVVAQLRMEEGSTALLSWWLEYSILGFASRIPLEGVQKSEEIDSLISSIDHAGRSQFARTWPSLGAPVRIPAWRLPAVRRIAAESHAIEGLRWEVHDSVSAVQVSNESMRISMSVHESESDWFDLRVCIRVGEHEIQVREAIQALLRGEDHIEIAGQWVRLDGPRILALQRALEEAAQLTDSQWDNLRMSPYQLGLYESLSADADLVEASSAWRRRVDELGKDAPTVPIFPASLKKVVRPYQEAGRAWLSHRMTSGLGGILADDMGLGKTLQILAAISSLRGEATATNLAPILVVAPTSVVDVWAQQATRFTPHLTVRALTESSAKRGTPLSEETRGADLVLTSYTLMRMDANEWADIELGGLVLDEAQAVKNPRTATHRALRSLRRPWCVAVSGTPVENSVGDLWALLALTCPGLLPSWDTFVRTLRIPIEGHGDGQALARLRTYIAPFVLRRAKEEVAQDLPDKVTDVVAITLGHEHRRIYDHYLARERTRILSLLDDLGANRMNILASITRMRQLALDPALVEENYANVGSAKIEYLAQQLDQILPLGHQVLVFSQFTSFLARIRSVLERRGVRVAQLDGTTRARARVISDFRSGRAQVFLISLKAGGTGLTLTEADYVYLMDPWWNPAAEEQAIDRAHRIGQTKKVNVYRLVARDTIESKVMELQDRKRRLVSNVMDGHKQGRMRITAHDLRALLD